MPRHLPAAVLVLAVALVAAALATSTSGAPAGPPAASRTIASATTGDFRAVIVATKLGGGLAPEASVALRTFELVDGRWRLTAEPRLRGTYFWKTVTGPRAVCRLEIRAAGATVRFRPRAVVQLLVGPSLGCGAVLEHTLAPR